MRWPYFAVCYLVRGERVAVVENAEPNGGRSFGLWSASKQSTDLAT